VEICTIHNEETVSTLIAEIATHIANYVKQAYCTIIYYTIIY